MESKRPKQRIEEIREKICFPLYIYGITKTFISPLRQSGECRTTTDNVGGEIVAEIEEGKTWREILPPTSWGGGEFCHKLRGNKATWRGRGVRGDTETTTSYLGGGKNGGKEGQGSSIVWGTYHFLLYLMCTTCVPLGHHLLYLLCTTTPLGRQLSGGR